MPSPSFNVRAGEPSKRAPIPSVEVELRCKTIVLVGLMGAGKTTIGRGLAAALGMSFRDADEEIERAAGCSVVDLFAERGEAEFRDGERRVIARLITQEPPHVLALGGGAFINAETRELVREHARSVWLKTDPGILARRVARKNTRPLLHGKDPLTVLKAHAEARYPLYAEALITVETGEAGGAATVDAVIAALSSHLAAQPVAADMSTL